VVPVPEVLPDAAHGGAELGAQLRGHGDRQGASQGEAARHVETSLRPPGAQVPLLGNFTFRDGVVKNDKTTIVCGGVLP
jgi:hypothetical protein